MCLSVRCFWCREVCGLAQPVYVLPDDDMRRAIETCRSSESVLV
jgi:hypothetical protein